MTTLMQTLKHDQLQARKAKDTATASLLTTLIGEAAMIGKNNGNRETDDAEVLAVIKKFVKNISESLNVRDDDALVAEKVILESYMPRQLSQVELVEVIAGIVAEIEPSEVSPRQMGTVMKELKTAYNGLYDGKAASAIVKTMLA